MNYKEVRDLRRNTSNVRVAIKEVNALQGYIQAQDAYGGLIRISVNLQDPIVALPAIGETWTVSRTGNEWTLDKRIETGQEQTSFGALVAGDRRLEAPRNLYLNGQQVYLNGEDLIALLEQIKTLLGI